MSWTVDERPGLSHISVDEVDQRWSFYPIHAVAADDMRHAERPMMGLTQNIEQTLRRLVAVVPQLGRYTVVSAAALALDFAVFLGLMDVGVGPTPAGVLGYAVGLALHYALSTRFVFDADHAGKPAARLFGEFVLSGIAGIAITAAVIAAATGLAGLPAIVAKALAVGASFLAVFLMRRQIVFAPVA